MFREMRRKNQLLPEEDTKSILTRCTAGTLALLGDDGYPYSVPVSFVYCDGKIYFHGAKAGHKVDAITACSKVSFSVIDKDDVVPEKLTTYFRSVIAFGKARIVTDPQEVKCAMYALAKKYSPDASDERIQKAMDSEKDFLCVVAMDIEHLTGKQAAELMKKA